jgi:hypothetical protein
METLAVLICLAAVVVGLFALLFALGQVVSLEGLRRIGRGLWPLQWNLWQMMTGVAMTALVLVIFEWGYGILFVVTLVSLLVVAWFFRNWRNEFIFLMGLRDDDFPGRHDKLIWAILLLAFPPITVWFFRSYHLAHWPEPGSAVETQVKLDPETPKGTAAQPA